MKKLAIITVVLLSTFLMSCSVEDDDDFSSETINIQYTQIDYEIVELLNTYRTSKGLNTLNILNQISKEAITHNNYMVGQGSPSHDYFSTRVQNLSTSVNAKTVAENVGYGYSSAQAVVNAWINSSGHKENIENPKFTDFGISTKKDQNGKNYFTNIFVEL